MDPPRRPLFDRDGQYPPIVVVDAKPYWLVQYQAAGPAEMPLAHLPERFEALFVYGDGVLWSLDRHTVDYVNVGVGANVVLNQCRCGSVSARGQLPAVPGTTIQDLSFGGSPAVHLSIPVVERSIYLTDMPNAATVWYEGVRAQCVTENCPWLR
jgi:hypothetical protein